jgi:hypothetical protein
MIQKNINQFASPKPLSGADDRIKRPLRIRNLQQATFFSYILPDIFPKKIN